MAQFTCSPAHRLVIVLLSALTLLCSARTADAFAHLWQIKEVFSNADGSVQFIEMFDSFSGEEFLTGQSVRATSTGSPKTFTFDEDLVTPPATGGRHLLIATPDFASLPGGIMPDYFLPDPIANGPFFEPNATTITITFLLNGDTMTFSGAALPKDGVTSLTDAGAFGFPPGTPNISSGNNSPTNFAGQIGSLNLAGPTGDYNGNHIVDGADYIVWRNTLTQAATPSGSGADGNNSGTIDAGDYTFWRSKFGNAAGSGSGAASAVPEPSAGAFLLLMMLAARFGRRRR
jgi:hypothetical protein